MPRLGGIPPCPRGGYRRRRTLASGPGGSHGPEQGGMGCSHLLLRSSHAGEGGGGTAEAESLASQPPRETLRASGAARRLPATVDTGLWTVSNG